MSGGNPGAEAPGSRRSGVAPYFRVLCDQPVNEVFEVFDPILVPVHRVPFTAVVVHGLIHDVPEVVERDAILVVGQICEEGIEHGIHVAVLTLPVRQVPDDRRGIESLTDEADG